MKKRICLTLLMGFFTLINAFAQHLVSGVVTDSDGESLPGVSIVVEGTTTGVVTGVDGRYEINVPDDQSVLIFTFIGMEDQAIPVDGRATVNVTMTPTAIDLDEVVVTALGITRDQRSLGYSVSRVSGEELQRVTQENFLTGLAGQVAGVSIRQTGPAGSTVDMTIRGESSLVSDNQPLYVVDGIPFYNTMDNVTYIGDRNPVDFGSAISDINPNDILEISVLKGPSAAALYGSRAGNGVVLITTKSGAEQEGFNVEINSTSSFDFPYKYLNKHKSFAPGGRPFDNENFPANEYGVPIIDQTSSGWRGPELDKGIMAIQWPFSAEEIESGVPVATELVSYDNPANFFQTAITTDNNISISNQTDLLTYRFSYSNMQNRGFIPNTDIGRNNISSNAIFRISDNLTVNTRLSYVQNQSDNRPATGGRGTNVLQALYEVNPHIDVREMRDYWEEGREGIQQRNPYSWGDPDRRSFDNPWFLAYEVTNSFKRDRVYGNIGLAWEIAPNLVLNTSYNHDEYNETRESKFPLSIVNHREPLGGYGIIEMRQMERNTDARLSYNAVLDPIDFMISFGGSEMYQRGSNSRAATRPRGSGLITPGVYSLTNIAPDNLDYGSSWYQRAIYSVYGLTSIGYRDMVYLDLTARNDWSSTLPEENRSYFYPSASLSVLASSIFDLPEIIDMFRLRGGYAVVGNDTDPYRLYPSLSTLSAWGSSIQMQMPSELLTPDLKPEEKTSYEIGAELILFGRRLTLDGTIYRDENRNQILRIDQPLSTGYSRSLINAGLIEARGWEATIGGVPVTTSDLRWRVNLMLSRDRVSIKELAPGHDFISFADMAGFGARTFVGDEIGQLLDNRLVRVDDPNSEYYGWPLLSSGGGAQTDGTVMDADGNSLKENIGNFNHDLMVGFQSNLSYRQFALDFSLDWRVGGQFISAGHRYHNSNHHFQSWFDNRMTNLSHIDDLPSYLKENADKYLIIGEGEMYTIVGGTTAEMGGFPVTSGGITLNDGAFIPGVIPQFDEDGNLTGYTENLGGEGTGFNSSHYHPWSLGRQNTFDADFIKLREISISYQLPGQFITRMGFERASVSLFSRNLILWTKAKESMDPEQAYTLGRGFMTEWGKGMNWFNTSPFTIPVGIRLNVNF